MSKVLYFDCSSGISGNMTLGALLELCDDPDYLVNELDKLHVDGYHIHISKEKKNGITGTYVDVHLEHPEHPDHHHHHHEHLTHEQMHELGIAHDHDHLTHEQMHELGIAHDHDHLTHEQMHELGIAHDHEHLTHEQMHELGIEHHHDHVHRNLYDVEKIIDDSDIDVKAKELAKRIFMRVALAESKVHNEPLEKVHFHEVGAVDSIVDIIGTALLITKINPDHIYASIVNDGHGFIHCAHGMISVPVPATSVIFASSKAKTRQIDIDTELVTPTGAAIISELAESYGMMPMMDVKQIGWGCGSKDLKIPNILKVSMGEMEEDVQDTVTVMECNIDDCSGEILGYTMECLFAKGALDAFYTPIYMKKNRPAYRLTVIAENKDVEAMKNIIFKETTTIGMRYYESKRFKLERRIEERETPYGMIHVKVVKHDTQEYVYPEYEDVKELAKQTGAAMKEIIKSIK